MLYSNSDAVHLMQGRGKVLAGYIVTLSDWPSLCRCVELGVYSTRMAPSKRQESGWNIPQEGTFADYLTMKPGNHIYFFYQRKIYGIGELADIQGESRFLAYIDADKPHVPTEEEYEEANPLLPDGSPNNRCFCVFRPMPQFFENGIDMDDVLDSNPGMFRMLRVMWKVSFIKVDDDEDQALQDILLKRNESRLEDGSTGMAHDDGFIVRLQDMDMEAYRFRGNQIVINALTDDGSLRHEMALEAGLCDVLHRNGSTVFGSLDYVSHQVVASPFKPVDYMDKMDIFGYQYIQGYRTRSRYAIIELKKGYAITDVIWQIMKYVDFVTREYAHGDYSMVQAYVVAYVFPEDVRTLAKNVCVRNYMRGVRPAEQLTWTAVKLIEYRVDADGKMQFKEIGYGD